MGGTSSSTEVWESDCRQLLIGACSISCGDSSSVEIRLNTSVHADLLLGACFSSSPRVVVVKRE
jgi:hypothetical protein